MPDPAKPRYLFIDLLRGWAVILMIEGHVVNGLLRPDLKETSIFGVIHFLNGVVAPAFLFMSGFTFAVASQRKWEEYLLLQRSLFRQLGRLLFILLLAYALHAPYFSLRKIVNEATPEDVASFLQVDILHTIAISLLVLLLVLLIVRREKRLRYSSVLVAVAVVFLTPIIWDFDFTRIFPLPIANYFNMKQRSVFPLFPWSAFVFCGTFISQLFLSALQKGEERKMIGRIFWGGGAVAIVGLVLDPLLTRIYPTYDFWHTSPSFFMIRLGIVIMAISGMWLYEKKVNPRSSFLQVIGQESLFVYALHIVIVYGTGIRGGSLVQVYGGSLNFAGCAAAYFALAGVTCVIGYAWHFLKMNQRPISRIVQYTTVGLILYFFLTRPY